MAVIEVGLLTVEDLLLLSRRTKVVGQKRGGEPNISGDQMRRADYVVVKTHKGLVLIKSRNFFPIGMRVHPERTRFSIPG